MDGPERLQPSTAWFQLTSWSDRARYEPNANGDDYEEDARLYPRGCRARLLLGIPAAL
jgi:hypothetical protein